MLWEFLSGGDGTRVRATERPGPEPGRRRQRRALWASAVPGSREVQDWAHSQPSRLGKLTKWRASWEGGVPTPRAPARSRT